MKNCVRGDNVVWGKSSDRWTVTDLEASSHNHFTLRVFLDLSSTIKEERLSML
jgi:hypothetical protein